MSELTKDEILGSCDALDYRAIINRPFLCNKTWQRSHKASFTSNRVRVPCISPTHPTLSLILGSDWRMWSGGSEALKSRYTSDNDAAWLQMGAFLVALKIWQQNASDFRRYGNYPREVTTPAIRCWVLCHVLHAISIPHNLANHTDL